MGLTGSILRKKHLLSFEETKSTSIKILSSLGYKVKPWNEDLNGKDYCSISVQKNDTSWFIMYIYRKENFADEYIFFTYLLSSQELLTLRIFQKLKIWC